MLSMQKPRYMRKGFVEGCDWQFGGKTVEEHPSQNQTSISGRFRRSVPGTNSGRGFIWSNLEWRVWELGRRTQLDAFYSTEQFQRCAHFRRGGRE
jgi:hypothetical protein